MMDAIGISAFFGYLFSGLFLIVIPATTIIFGVFDLAFSFVLPTFVPGLADRNHDKIAEYSKRKRNRYLSRKYRSFTYFGWILFVIIFSNSYLSELIAKGVEKGIANTTSENMVEFYITSGSFALGMSSVSGPLEMTPVAYIFCALCLGAAIVGVLALSAEKRDLDE